MLVNYTKPNVSLAYTSMGEPFTFIPGINQINEPLWKRLLENKHFKSDVDAKVYIVEDEKDPEIGDDGEPAPILKNISSDKDITRIIKDTYDLKTLKEMRRSETRRDVISTIDAQIQKLQEERRNARGRANQDEED